MNISSPFFPPDPGIHGKFVSAPRCGAPTPMNDVNDRYFDAAPQNNRWHKHALTYDIRSYPGEMAPSEAKGPEFVDFGKKYSFKICEIQLQ